jgi:uncharacterized membrane protein YkoI
MEIEMLIHELRRNLLGAAVASTCALLTGTALAAPRLTDDPTEAMSALGNLDTVSVSLPHAIAAIETKTGGRVMDIRYEGDSGQPVYDAVVVTPHDVGVARIYGETGTPSGIADEFSIASLDWKQRSDVTSFNKATVPLSAAIENVEQLSGGHVVDAGLAKPLTPDNDVLAYNVEYAMNGTLHTVAIDATTGEVIADPDALGLSEADPSDFLLGAAE